MPSEDNAIIRFQRPRRLSVRGLPTVWSEAVWRIRIILIRIRIQEVKTFVTDPVTDPG